MSRASVKASTSPSTPSAPTTCNVSSRSRSPPRPRPQLRFGHIPGNAPTVEGLQRKLEPLSFCLFAVSQKKNLPSKPAGAEIATSTNNKREVVMRLEGGCYCGEVRYVAEGDPMMQAQCHCRECQYISGGAPNTFIAMPAEIGRASC